MVTHTRDHSNMMINGEPNANFAQSWWCAPQWSLDFSVSCKNQDICSWFSWCSSLHSRKRLRSRGQHYKRKSHDLPRACTFIMRLFQLSFSFFFFFFFFFNKNGNPVTKESGCFVLYSMYFWKKLYLYYRLLYFKSSISLRKESS